MLKPFAVFVSLAFVSPAIALAGSESHDQKHSHQETKSASHGDHDNHSAMKEGVHADAKINTISDNTVNLSHGPIPDIGWPAMTMDLPLLPGAEVGDVAAGDEVMMMLQKGDDGLYGIRALMPK